MKLTKFPKLKRAIEALDANAIAKKLKNLSAQLRQDGIGLEPKNTAFTQEGIFYIEPESGIATKVVAYIAEFPTVLTKAQQSNLEPEGYFDHRSIVKFHPYHLMRCNTVNLSEREGWTEKYRVAKRPNGKFFYRIVSEIDPKTDTREIYQVIEDQRLYICSYCLWKVGSILPSAQGTEPESFELKMFFDVNMMLSWNSHGQLSKDHGFTKDMYPDDWLEISRIRMEQTNYQCESCFEDLSDRQLRRFLYVHPTDHVEGEEGYVRLNSLCICCLADISKTEKAKQHPEVLQYLKVREILRDRLANAEFGGGQPSFQ